MGTRIFVLIACCTFALSASASGEVFKATNSGDWTDVNTWNGISYPSEGDSVYIDGYTVTTDMINITVQYIALTDSADISGTSLTVSGNKKLTVTGSVDLVSFNFKNDLSLDIMSSSSMEVGENINMIRPAGDFANDLMTIEVTNTASLKVIGNLVLDFDNTGTTNGGTHIHIHDTALIQVDGDVDVNTEGGGNFHFHIRDGAKFIGANDFTIIRNGGAECKIHAESDSTSTLGGNLYMEANAGTLTTLLQLGNTQGTFIIDGNLSLVSGAADQRVESILNGSATTLNVKGDIIMTAQGAGDVEIQTQSNAELQIGGSFSRAYYGSLTMDSGTKLTYNGTGAQTIAANDVTGSGTDEFVFADVNFSNSSGLPLSLADTLLITENLYLTVGKIMATANKPVIIEDQAMIVGGDTDAYIEGPIIKRGKSSGIFTFPLGHNNVYAPLQLSAISNSGSVYTAEYLNCPPPIGGLESGIAQVSAVEHWAFDWETGSNLVDFTLNWSNADSSGIDNTDSLLVVYNDGTNGWMSMGNKAISGGTGSNSGSVTGDGLNCPPPIGNLDITFGSTSPLYNALPAALTRFEVREETNRSVTLDWETATEVDFNRFEVERSRNAIDYQLIRTVRATANNTQGQTYRLIDDAPYYGKNYYRLKLIDDNGMYTYSDVRSLNILKENKFAIYPNPVADQINIYGLDRASTQGMLEVYNTAGHLLYKAQIDPQYGTVQIPVERLHLNSSGYYYLHLTDDMGKRVLKFLKL